jgi:hypothetical protein
MTMALALALLLPPGRRSATFPPAFNSIEKHTLVRTTLNARSKSQSDSAAAAGAIAAN